jgi:copper(I)-binding protein
LKNLLLGCLLASVFLGYAHADEIKISNAWVAETSPGQDTASIKLVITSRKNAKIVEVGSGMAEHVEIQSRNPEGSASTMIKVSELDIPAQTPVLIGEGDTQLVLIGLRQALVVGHKLPFALTVKFANGKTTLLRVLAVIKPINKLVVQGREFADLAIIQ